MTILDKLTAALAAGTARPWNLAENERDLELHGERTVDYILGPKQYESDGCGGSCETTERIVTTDGGHYGPQPADADLIIAAVNNLEVLVKVAKAAEAYQQADEEHENAVCTCGGYAEGAIECPQTATAENYELARSRLRAALQALDKETP